MKELAKAKLDMEVLKQEHQQLSNKLQQYSIFNKYLETVVEVSEVSLDPRGSHMLRWGAEMGPWAAAKVSGRDEAGPRVPCSWA